MAALPSTTTMVVRPVWRGRLHRHAAVAAVPLFVAIAVSAQSGTARAACIVYGLGVTTMFAVSATYHAAGLPARWKQRLRRVDHSTILLAIAGTYTAVATFALSGAPERRVLTAVWVGAIVGVVIRMTWLRAPAPLVAVVYVVVGWSALIEIGPLLAALDAIDTALVIGGGALYTAGAAVYALRRPDPVPTVFGYHEVFHALVVTAAVMHGVLVVRLLGST